MFLKILDYINFIFFALLVLSVLLLIYKIIYHIYGLMPAKKFPEAKKNHKYAIIIPARYESNVIEGLLISIKNQDYPSKNVDTYVIVESIDDSTCEICKRYKDVNIYIRPNIEVKSKGGALDQIFKEFLKNGKGYEAYFIFDADNIMAPTYLSEMNKAYDAGYKMALAYRNSKNWNDGWVAACSAAMFSILNTFQNKCRARFNQNVLVSGTGFYIAHDIIENLGGWPFVTLTEDYEISLYTVLNNIKSTYNEYAEFFDEQPSSLKVSWNQRLRWVRGFHQNGKIKKELIKRAIIDKENRWSKFEFGINVVPILVPIVSVVCYTLLTFTMGIVGLCKSYLGWEKAIEGAIWAILGIYMFFALYVLAIIIAERKHIDLRFWNAVRTIFMAPIYFALYLPLYFLCIFKKDVKWTRIDHGVKNNTLFDVGVGSKSKKEIETEVKGGK